MSFTSGQTFLTSAGKRGLNADGKKVLNKTCGGAPTTIHYCNTVYGACGGMPEITSDGYDWYFNGVIQPSLHAVYDQSVIYAALPVTPPSIVTVTATGGLLRACADLFGETTSGNSFQNIDFVPDGSYDMAWDGFTGPFVGSARWLLSLPNFVTVKEWHASGCSGTPDDTYTSDLNVFLFERLDFTYDTGADGRGLWTPFWEINWDMPDLRLRGDRGYKAYRLVCDRYDRKFAGTFYSQDDGTGFCGVAEVVAIC